MFGLIKVCYLIIAAFILILTVWNMMTEEDWKEQLNGLFVVIPLLLRVLLLK